MPVTKVANVITYTAPADGALSAATDVHRKDDFAVCDVTDKTKQIAFNPSALAAGATATITADAANTGALTLPPFTSAVLGAMNRVLQSSAPTEAATVTIAAATQVYVGIPSGNLTTLTQVMPTAPPNGSVVSWVYDHAVTNLVLSFGGSDAGVGTPTAAVANTPKSMVYKSSTAKWYLI